MHDGNILIYDKGNGGSCAVLFNTVAEWVSNFSNSMPDEVVYTIRIIVAAACGGAIGLERSKRQKEAGIRTHLIVALGAALMMVVSKYAFFDVVLIPDARISVDASRIAANVITGVSFLGAGVIFVKDLSIKGLTTAAGIWATSGVGMAIGAGMPWVGIISTVLIIILQIVLHKIEGGMDVAVNTYMKVRLKDNNNGAVERLINVLEEHNIEVENQKIKRRETYLSVILSLKIPKGIQNEKITTIIEDDEDIISIEV